MSHPYSAVVAGVSLGGVEALITLLSGLPVSFPLPLAIVLHIPPGEHGRIARYLDKVCDIHVKEADEKEPFKPGVVYTAPANYHLLIEKDRSFSLSVDARVNFSRPSIDVLFCSAADVFGEHLIGLLLTGSNHDGAAGLAYLHDHGGLTIVEDPETAHCAEMPLAGIKATQVDYIRPIEEIPPLLCQLAGACP